MQIYWVLPLLGALIGWTTNIIAIKSLFRPYRKIKIGPFKIQGLLPRYQYELAEKIGQTLERELLTPEELGKHWRNLGLEEEAEIAIENFLKERIGKWLSLFPDGVQNGIYNSLRQVIIGDIHEELETFREKAVTRLTQKSSVGRIVTDKINTLSMQEVEKLVLGVISRELRYVELLGGVLGFIVGLFQMLILMISG